MAIAAFRPSVHSIRPTSELLISWNLPCTQLRRVPSVRLSVRRSRRERLWRQEPPRGSGVRQDRAAGQRACSTTPRCNTYAAWFLAAGGGPCRELNFSGGRNLQPRNGSCGERIALIPFVRSEFQLLRSFTLRVRLLRSRQTTKDDGLPHGSLRQLPNLGL